MRESSSRCSNTRKWAYLLALSSTWSMPSRTGRTSTCSATSWMEEIWGTTLAEREDSRRKKRVSLLTLRVHHLQPGHWSRVSPQQQCNTSRHQTWKLGPRSTRLRLNHWFRNSLNMELRERQRDLRHSRLYGTWGYVLIEPWCRCWLFCSRHYWLWVYDGKVTIHW